MTAASTGATTAPSARPEDWQPRIIAMVCNWCTYAGADMAGTARLKYPHNVRMVRFPCTGRMNPLMILKAFEHGADGVIVSGCHPGDRHYVQGNLVARRRFTVMRSLLEFVGIDMRRVHFAWVSAAEGKKWAGVVSDVTTQVEEAGPLVPYGRPDDPAPIELPPIATPAERPQHDANMTEALRGHLRAAATDLLESERVKEVVGYASGRLRTKPHFATTAAACAQLAFDDTCHPNLAGYLPAAIERSGRVAVLAKQCDIGAVIGLIRENQISRDDVVLVGVACAGMRGEDEVASKCLTCNGQPHELCDLVVDVEGVRDGTAAAKSDAKPLDNARDAQVEYLESLPAEVRWQFWQDQFERCTRCYACRASCPLCYCSSCISEKHRPQWVSPAIDAQGNTAWNLIRAYHLAGRCTGCDECARACPADIRLDLLNHKLRREVERHFGVQDDDPAGKSALVDFRMNDPQEFVL